MPRITAEKLLDPAFPHARVEACVARQWAAHGRAEFLLCIALRRLYRDRVHRRDSRARFGDGAEQVFGIPVKLANLFSFLGSHFERLPGTRAEVEAGRLSYTKAREFAALATPEDEAGWIGFALSHTNRQLERRVADGGGKPARMVKTPLTPEEVQAVRKARETLTKELCRSGPSGPESGGTRSRSGRNSSISKFRTGRRAIQKGSVNSTQRTGLSWPRCCAASRPGMP